MKTEKSSLERRNDLAKILKYFVSEDYRNRFIDKIIWVARKNFRPITVPVLAENYAENVDTIRVDADFKISHGRTLTWEQAEEVTSRTFLEALRQIQHYLSTAKKEQYYIVHVAKPDWLVDAIEGADVILHVPDAYNRMSGDPITERQREHLPTVVKPIQVEYDFGMNVLKSVQDVSDDQEAILAFMRDLTRNALVGLEISCSSVDGVKELVSKYAWRLSVCGLEFNTYFDQVGIPGKLRKQVVIASSTIAA